MKTVLHIACTGRIAAAGLALLMAMATQAIPAEAQSTAAPRFAIIDVQQILRESVAAKGLNKEITEFRNVYQAELRKQATNREASEPIGIP